MFYWRTTFLLRTTEYNTLRQAFACPIKIKNQKLHTNYGKSVLNRVTILLIIDTMTIGNKPGLSLTFNTHTPKLDLF